jgi:hypothetical protein
MDVAGIFESLGGASFENMFVIAGLVFIAVAVFGNISGKIAPGAYGRVGSGAIGIALLSAGLWMHAGPSLMVKMVQASVDSPRYEGQCPITVTVSGIVEAQGTGNVTYNFLFSDKRSSPPSSIAFTGPNSQVVTAKWQVSSSMPTGFVQLKTITPNAMVSDPSEPFSVVCTTPQAPPSAPAPLSQSETAAPQPAPAVPAPPPPTEAVAGQPPKQQPPAGHGPTAKELAALKFSAMQGPGTSVLQGTDSVAIVSALPANGTVIKRGAPFNFSLAVQYELSSAPTGILSISVGEARGSCSSDGELSDAVQVPILRGKHTTNLQLTWSGDTGLATKGRVYGSGFLRFTPMFWQNQKGLRGERIKQFPASYCYRFE